VGNRGVLSRIEGYSHITHLPTAQRAIKEERREWATPPAWLDTPEAEKMPQKVLYPPPPQKSLKAVRERTWGDT
jgi:hypothetical protein